MTHDKKQDADKPTPNQHTDTLEMTPAQINEILASHEGEAEDSAEAAPSSEDLSSAEGAPVGA